MQHVKSFNQHKNINESTKYSIEYKMTGDQENKDQKRFMESFANKYKLEQNPISIVSVEGYAYDDKRDIHILLSNGFFIDFIWEETGRITYAFAAAYTKYIDLSDKIDEYIKKFNPDESNYTELAMEIFEDWYNGKIKIDYKAL